MNAARGDSVERLISLSWDADTEVLCYVANNERTPLEVLRRLATDPDMRVRHSVAGNSAADDALLDSLSDDPSWRVRARVAYRADLSPQIRLRLLGDVEDYVAQAATNYGAS